MSRFRKAKYQQVHQATLLDEEEDDTISRDFKTLNLKSTERVGKKFSLSGLLGAGRRPSASGSADNDGYDALTSPVGPASSNTTQQTTTAQNQTEHRRRVHQDDDNNDTELQGGVNNSIKDLIVSACVIADLFKDIKEQAAGGRNSELETELRGQAAAIQSQIAEILQADAAPDEESLITALALNDTLIELLQDRKVDDGTGPRNQQGSEHQESSPSSPSPNSSGEEQVTTTDESTPPSTDDFLVGELGPQAEEQQPRQPTLCEEPPLIEL